jgi:hypothetical protein
VGVLNRGHGDHVQTGGVYVVKTWQPPNEKESLRAGEGIRKNKRKGNGEGSRKGARRGGEGEKSERAEKMVLVSIRRKRSEISR